MSPNVGNFVHDLVEMAKAMETLPQVQAANERLQKDLDTALQTVQERELAIYHYKVEIDGLNSKVRSLEVERDDASFRVLEAEDLNHAILNRARSAAVDLALIIDRLDPPKPVPEPEVLVGTSLLQPQAAPTTEPDLYPHAGHGYDQSQGSSEVNPTDTVTASPDTDVSNQQQTATNTVVPIVEEVPKSDANPTKNGTTEQGFEHTSSIEAKGPYFGKRYHDMPNYISRWDWLDGGGSESDYYWQPARDTVF